MANSNACGPLGHQSNKPAVDSGTLVRQASPQCGAVGTQEDRDAFELALVALKAEVTNLGAIGAIDGIVRARYDQLVREYRTEIVDRVRAGKTTWSQAAFEARDMRDEVMQMVRQRSTPVGRAFAEKIKKSSPTLNQLIAKKSIELFGNDAHFPSLTAQQQNRVYAAIVESAGKSNPKITARMQLASRAGRGLIVMSLAISVYNVATADNKVNAAMREGATMGAGVLGGAAGGALAGLACGPGAPVCVTIGAFAGGALAAIGVEFFW